MITPDITVVIPTIPPRAALLARAIRSVLGQELPARALSVAVDTDRAGAPATRQRALEAVQTPWVAFLDDDDEFMPQHLRRLVEHQRATSADYVYSWFTVIGGVDPFPPEHFTAPFNPAQPRQTTVTTLVRTNLAKSVRFCPPESEREVGGQRWGEDYDFTLGCLAQGAKISHLVERTWYWHHDSGNTSGRPDRW